MHWVIDIIVFIVLLFFFLSGWHKGFLLSLLGVVRVVLAYGVAYFAGRYIGAWLGEVAHRPRIVTIPVVAGFTFALISFVFHIIMSNIRDGHRDKEEKEVDFHFPWPSCLSGGVINLGIGLFSTIFLFWLGDLFMVGASGRPIPGANKSNFASVARRTVYETVHTIIRRDGHESQAAASARVISNPARGLVHLEHIIGADSVQLLIRDQEFGKCLMSGDREAIGSNAALQRLLDDEETLNEMKELGIFSGEETKEQICESLSKFGGNEKIQASMDSLRARGLISTDQIIILIRDPEFDAIMGELLR